MRRRASPDGTTVDAGELERLDATWSDKPGWVNWLSSIDHKSIGRRYIATAFGFFVAGGILAVLMRTQLARPENALIGPDLYNQIFTMHGTTMMFLFAVPVMEAMAVYLVPLMIGSRAVALPRMLAFSYWIYLFGGLMLYGAFLMNVGPDVGWFAYVPLSGPQYGPGKRPDVWAQLVVFAEIGTELTAVVIITTIFKLRAPRMTLNRLPLFVWAMLVTSLMILFAMPAVVYAAITLLADRAVGTHFYNPAEGGDAQLWQHIFWFFGHPEVYIIFLPALGMMSPIIATFARRPIFGYPLMVLSLITTGFLGFGLWVHHMFAADIPELGKSFFTVASMLIAMPTAAQTFCWIATLWSGRINLRTPLLFVLAWFVILIIGGLSGIMLAAVPLDLQVHDTYFVVAHFHYVLLGGAVFPLFGGFYYWYPKVTGRLLSEKLGKWNFWLFFVGFNITFFPMHHLGLHGMPRRVYTYPLEAGWGGLNLLSSLGAATIAASMLVFVVNVVVSYRRGAVAGNNPWGASTLEWATASPPPSYNFARVPVLASREPLWERGGVSGRVEGLASDTPEVLVTRLLDAEPDHRYAHPHPSIWPFATAVALAIVLIATLFTPWALVWGMVPLAVTLTGWFWPGKKETEEHLARERKP
jgi:cytochrome c oxidase subunit I+III